MMAETAEDLVRECNTCKHVLPWTLEHFDWKRGNPAFGLNRVCRACLDKHHRNGEARAAQIRRREERKAARLQGDRTTPNRLVYGLQPNHMEWPEWMA